MGRNQHNPPLTRSLAPFPRERARLRASEAQRPRRECPVLRVTQLIVLSLLGTAVAGAIDLRIPPQPVKNGTVFFTNTTGETIPTLPFDYTSDDVRSAMTNHYAVFVLIPDIGAGKYEYVRYRFYVGLGKPPNLEGLTRVNVQARPDGQFKDQVVDVKLQLTDGAMTEEAVLRLPVYGTAALLEKPNFQTPAEVTIGSAAPIPVSLQNLLTDLPIVVHATSKVTSRNPRLWSRVAIQFPDDPRGGGDALLLPNETRPVVVVAAQPNLWQVIGATLVPVASRNADDHLDVELRYASRGGYPQHVEFEIPVRFAPWFPLLFAAAALGALVGFLVRLLNAVPADRAAWPKLAIATVLLTFIGEAIALLLHSKDSRLVLFGVDFDPTQLLPATLLGAMIGFQKLTTIDSVIAIFTRKKQ